jgi:hypothetical protein
MGILDGKLEPASSEARDWLTAMRFERIPLPFVVKLEGLTLLYNKGSVMLESRLRASILQPCVTTSK